MSLLLVTHRSILSALEANMCAAEIEFNNWMQVDGIEMPVTVYGVVDVQHDSCTNPDIISVYDLDGNAVALASLSLAELAAARQELLAAFGASIDYDFAGYLQDYYLARRGSWAEAAE